MRSLARWIWIVGLLPLAGGCGDSLSSLETVRESRMELFGMTLNPDFGRRGTSVDITVTLDPELRSRLGSVEAYPAEIGFGKGTFIQSFSYESPEKLNIAIFVDPLAEEGMRRPELTFSVERKGLRALGKFWILPALASY